ncbi:acyl carrier protein [Sanguibacter suaedae]|uniref:Acyl carrier protein n=1 Tax=Sanguibacter suaedae TaxID=2795737 RepID=A0A934IB89_9MICO|nr:acyl carrier protein [Sanguibacter suaedae]MBI9115252.1 acyl carrier protein [Sanguibacter suaedae]
MDTTLTTSDLVRDYVIDEFLPGADPEQVTPQTDLLNSGIIDSLGLLKLIAWLETRFEIGIDDTDLDPENFRNLNTITAFVERPRPTPGSV